MAKRYHPDSSNDSRNADEESAGLSQEKRKELFQQVQMAYEVLSNEEKRREYDSYRGRSYYENQYQEAAQGEE
jgi:DnaJ-class molecular chaperone